MPDAFTDTCRRHARDVGANPTAIDGVGVYRVDHPTPPTHAVYTPAVFVVATGRKRTVVGRRSYEYDPDHYLVTAVPLPVVSEILQASPTEPFLALTLTLDLADARELVALSPAPPPSAPEPPERGLAAVEVPPRLREAALRLVQLLDHPDDLPALARPARREVLYHVLRGPQGGFVRALAQSSARHQSLDAVLRSLHADCSRPVAVPDLARRAGMSESSFFEAFKRVTGVSPLQYVKRLRLVEARRRLAHGLQNVSGAAESVGYASLSQFSREFTRMFGENPSRVAPGADPVSAARRRAR